MLVTDTSPSCKKVSCVLHRCHSVVRGRHVATKNLIVADDRARNCCARSRRQQAELVLDDRRGPASHQDILPAVVESKMQISGAVHGSRTVSQPKSALPLRAVLSKADIPDRLASLAQLLSARKKIPTR